MRHQAVTRDDVRAEVEKLMRRDDWPEMLNKLIVVVDTDCIGAVTTEQIVDYFFTKGRR